jgi:hypothetical protein
MIPMAIRSAFQDLRILLAVVRLRRALFLIPKTNPYGFITFRGDKADFFLKSLWHRQGKLEMVINPCFRHLYHKPFSSLPICERI